MTYNELKDRLSEIANDIDDALDDYNIVNDFFSGTVPSDLQEDYIIKLYNVRSILLALKRLL